jgi:hypothetical protein
LEHHHWTMIFGTVFFKISHHIVARRKGTHFLDPDRDGAV